MVFNQWKRKISLLVDNEFKSDTNDEYQIMTDVNDTTIRRHKHHVKTKQGELFRNK